MLDTAQHQNFKQRTGRVLETGKNLHSENKELTKGRMQQSDAKERVTGGKKSLGKLFLQEL